MADPKAGPPPIPKVIVNPRDYKKDKERGKWTRVRQEVARAPDNEWHRYMRILIAFSRERKPPTKCLCSLKGGMTSDSKIDALTKWGDVRKTAHSSDPRSKTKGRPLKSGWGGGPWGGVAGGGGGSSSGVGGGEKARKIANAAKALTTQKFQHCEDTRSYVDEYRKRLHPVTANFKITPDPYREKLRNMGNKVQQGQQQQQQQLQLQQQQQQQQLLLQQQQQPPAAFVPGDQRQRPGRRDATPQLVDGAQNGTFNGSVVLPPISSVNGASPAYRANALSECSSSSHNLSIQSDWPPPPMPAPFARMPPPIPNARKKSIDSGMSSGASTHLDLTDMLVNGGYMVELEKQYDLSARTPCPPRRMAPASSRSRSSAQHATLTDDNLSRLCASAAAVHGRQLTGFTQQGRRPPHQLWTHGPHSGGGNWQMPPLHTSFSNFRKLSDPRVNGSEITLWVAGESLGLWQKPGRKAGAVPSYK